MGSLRARGACYVPGLRVLLLVVAVAVAGGLALVVGLPGVDAKTHSAYADPQKPVLSFVLSRHRNVEEFQREFGLGDEKVQEVLAVVHEEDTDLSREYDESERIVGSHKGASEAQIRNKISASDFDEKVRHTVARTKSRVEDLLPDGRASDLGPWVDEQWQAEASYSAASSEPTYSATSVGYVCTVYATYYTGNTRYEVALPHRKVAFSGGRKVAITPVRGGTRTRAPVKDIGPWNIRDNYWRASEDRSMWTNLPRCMPEAQAAFFRDYQGGKDQFGREVLNPAGIDITLAVARSMDAGRRIQREGYLRVRVHYLWAIT